MQLVQKAPGKTQEQWYQVKFAQPVMVNVWIVLERIILNAANAPWVIICITQPQLVTRLALTDSGRMITEARESVVHVSLIVKGVRMVPRHNVVNVIVVTTWVELLVIQHALMGIGRMARRILAINVIPQNAYTVINQLLTVQSVTKINFLRYISKRTTHVFNNVQLDFITMITLETQSVLYVLLNVRSVMVLGNRAAKNVKMIII